MKRVTTDRLRLIAAIMFTTLVACRAVQDCSATAAEESGSAGVNVSVLKRIGTGVDDGWTVFKRSDDTHVMYVSSSKGNDEYDGLSPERPLKTPVKALSLLRDGYPDWVLLRRGDVWFEPLGNLKVSGRSPREPILVGSYGDAGNRPKLMLGDHRSGLSVVGRETSNIAVVGIHFYDHKGDPASEHFVRDRVKGNHGIWYYSLGENVLIEDCRFEVLTGVIGLGRIWIPEGQPMPEWGMRNMQVRRCVVQGAWSTKGHCQGCFFNEVDGLLLEENVLDHNGWNLETGDLPTVFNHNVYITIECDNVVARGNIVTRGSTTGLYCRTNGILENNLCVDNSPALNLGRITKFRPGGVTGRISGNVVIGSPTRTGHKDIRIRSNGIEVGNINHRGVVVEDNIVIGTDGAEGFALKISSLGVGVHNAEFRRNVVHNWPRTLSWVGTPGDQLAKHQLSGIAFDNNLFQLRQRNEAEVSAIRCRDTETTQGIVFRENLFFHEPVDAKCVELMGRQLTLAEWLSETEDPGNQIEKAEFVAPDRTVGTYHGSIGKEETLDAFLQEACKQSKHNWRKEYTAEAVIVYIREGFRRKAAKE